MRDLTYADILQIQTELAPPKVTHHGIMGFGFARSAGMLDFYPGDERQLGDTLYRCVMNPGCYRWEDPGPKLERERIKRRVAREDACHILAAWVLAWFGWGPDPWPQFLMEEPYTIWHGPMT